LGQIFPRSSRKKRENSQVLAKTFFCPALLFFFLLSPSVLFAAPFCPGPVRDPALLLPVLGSAGDTPRALDRIARVLRDLPGGKSFGERALVRAGDLLRALPSKERESPLVLVERAERDTELVLYHGFPGGMRFGKRAEKAIDLALAKDSGLAQAHLLKGIALYYKPWFVGGSVTKALTEFERAGALRPGDPRTLSWIGVARHRLGRPGARTAMKGVLALCPESPFYRARAGSFDPRASHP